MPHYENIPWGDLITHDSHESRRDDTRKKYTINKTNGPPTPCEHCGKEFIKYIWNKRFCSTECQKTVIQIRATKRVRARRMAEKAAKGK